MAHLLPTSPERKRNLLTDWAYLAGLIDGEGYLGVRRRKGANGYIAYNPVISVAMTSKETIDFLHEMFQGGDTAVRQQGDHKPQYTWRPMRIQTMVSVLVAIKPFSITKRRQVILLEQICQYKALATGRREIKDPAYLAICEEMLTINKTGA